MPLTHVPEWQKAQRGELYHAFVPELVEARTRCSTACNAFNDTRDFSRRNLVTLWRAITCDERPLPPTAATPAEDDELFANDPWVCGPLRADYGFNIKLEDNAFLNFNSTFVDTCPITIGARTLVGPNCSFYSGTHPLDPALRMGTEGPELGKPITIGEDCWKFLGLSTSYYRLGGNVIVLPGVNIGRGCTIGAGSVVTKDIPAFHVAAGNPARVIRKIETVMDSSQGAASIPANETVSQGAEIVMAEQ